MSSGALRVGDRVSVHGVEAVVAFVGRLWAIVRVDGAPVRVDVADCTVVARASD